MCYGFAALALAAGSVLDRNCTDNDNLPAINMLSGEHLRIGLYVTNVGNTCNAKADGWPHNTTCALYGNITREDNKIYDAIGRFMRFKVWSGFDITLIEVLAESGNFTYTIVSMGGNTDPDVNGTEHPVTCTKLDGASCANCKALPWRTGRRPPATLLLSVHCSTLSFTEFTCTRCREEVCLSIVASFGVSNVCTVPPPVVLPLPLPPSHLVPSLPGV